MPSPIELMKPGEVPTEPGFYIVRTTAGDTVARVFGSHNPSRMFMDAIGFGRGMRVTDPTWLAFLARVYPDRIGEESKP